MSSPTLVRRALRAASAPVLCFVLGSCLVGLAPRQADATLLLFDLTSGGGSDEGAELEFVAGDVTLTASGWITGDGNAAGGTPASNAPFTDLSPRGLSVTSNGLGVWAGTGSPDSTQMDGFGPDEVLRLQFSEPVLLTRVTFALASVDDEFDFAFGPDLDPAGVSDVRLNQTYGADEITTLGTELGPGTLPVLDYEFTVGPAVFIGPTTTESQAPIGQTFEFYLTDAGDDYKIASVEVETGVNSSTFVPEPTTMGVLLVCLFGAAGVARVSTR